MPMLVQIENGELEHFYQNWHRFDVTWQKQIEIIAGNESMLGVAKGINAEGCLVVEIEDELREFATGNISVRQGKSI